MGKAVKIFLILAMIIGFSSLALGVLSAQEEGVSVMELGEILQDNLEELNISPVYREYSDIRERVEIDEADSRNIVITNTFPDLSLVYGPDMTVELYGDVSSRLDQLVSWKREGDTLTIDFASVFNENPTSTGLKAVVTLPGEPDRLKVTSISGDVEVLDLSGNHFDIEVKSGNISILDSGAEIVRAVSQSGNIHLVMGDLPEVTLRSASGNIDVDADALAGSLESLSGNMYARVDALNGDLSLTTASGNIVMIHEGSDYGYDLKSESGQVTWVTSDEWRKSFSGSHGDPVHSLTVSSGSGNIMFEDAP